MTRLLKLRQDAHPCGPRHRPPIFSHLQGEGLIFSLTEGKSLHIITGDHIVHNLVQFTFSELVECLFGYDERLRHARDLCNR